EGALEDRPAQLPSARGGPLRAAMRTRRARDRSCGIAAVSGQPVHRQLGRLLLQVEVTTAIRRETVQRANPRASPPGADLSARVAADELVTLPLASRPQRVEGPPGLVPAARSWPITQPGRPSGRTCRS